LRDFSDNDNIILTMNHCRNRISQRRAVQYAYRV
jgi:hypothetical protein